MILRKVMRRGVPVKDLSKLSGFPAMSALPPVPLPVHARPPTPDASVQCPTFHELVPAAWRGMTTAHDMATPCAEC